jgi:NADPH2 dehydrogenase
MNIFSEFNLKGKIIKNRIVLPPMVCFWYAGDDGLVTDRNLRHYTERAESGPGIIIVEATAVIKSGRLAPFQLGIWSDEHIPGMSKLASVIKSHGSLALLQIHHGGLVTSKKVAEIVFGPSADEKDPASRELTVNEIVEIREAFIAGAIRAKKAGFDGIELHGAHGYLLSEFASLFFNKRKDMYGESVDNRLRLAREIIQGIRIACGDDFIIDYRLGANAPALSDGIEIAQKLESYGIDTVHVSHGGSLLNLPRTPKDFEYNWIVYSGTEIKKQVKIPVIVVNEIKTQERAEYLIENGLADFAALGRPQLADPHWFGHIHAGQPVNECHSCKPKCRWYESSDLCPAGKKLRKEKEIEV